jgi:hypothetical protein
MAKRKMTKRQKAGLKKGRKILELMRQGFSKTEARRKVGA